MDKFTVNFSKGVEKLLEKNDYRRLNLIKHTLALVSYIIEIGATRLDVQRSFPVPSYDKMGFLVESKKLQRIVTVAYMKSKKIRVEVKPGRVKACFIVEINFLQKRRDGFRRLLVLKGEILPNAVKSLEVKLSRL